MIKTCDQKENIAKKIQKYIFSKSKRERERETTINNFMATTVKFQTDWKFS